ncbi:hypothetical protein [Undibacterium parvum]|uniref:Uncharacterized protein n=2 Tax=Undibacterium TaxID=401469 RepID=A0A6M4A5L6_9BURK|nr:hypothetical protein [Undibacterium parvum]AZP11800.1 hypothetical protein EJN92_07190 [Undibacterium parvum]QJQ06218.1 hypothetical protein EJG51_010515 [Undibacterium piscinae]
MKIFFKKTQAVWLVFTMSYLFSQASNAEQVLFPKAEPILSESMDPPLWMSLANGDDGYVRISAEVKIPPTSCIALGKNPFFGSKQTTQVALSLKTSGFQTNLSDKDIPIATFDSTGHEGDCISPAKLPITVIPLTRLESSLSGSVGDLRIMLNVRSTTNTKYELVQKAQIAVSAAAIFTTGAATIALTTLMGKIGEPALLPFIEGFEKYAGNMTNGSSVIEQDWIKIRKVPIKYEIPVYLAETKWDESAADVITRLQRGELDSNNKQFTVVLKFDYVRSIFDSAPIGPNYLPNRENSLTKHVLAYPEQPGLPNILQVLNSGSPSLGQDLSNPNKNTSETCNAIYTKLSTEIRLSKPDRAITMKAFIDESMHSSDWPQTKLFSDCFRDLKDTGEMIATHYGLGEVLPEVPDGQKAYGPTFPNFPKWKAEIPDLMAKIRGILTLPDNRNAALKLLNRGTDIEFIDYSTAWETPSLNQVVASSPTAAGGTGAVQSVTPLPTLLPNIEKFSSRKISQAGCFSAFYPDDTNMTVPKGYMLMLDDSNRVWLGIATFTDVRPRILSSFEVTQVVNGDGWHQSFSRKNYGENAICPSILNHTPI